ncbi:helix-turn-helix domain-containing protein [uncultured Adlercreutzia sp.]|uniref:helix-turn-helix domain-containing protein n=1 Tax=uncultured Adlercreutzia sp. TaxID=875803 RepID=UPI002600FC61|nr:helix-turn-helix domain-containing protein [uncultured Adlercreutzia sp.]
MGISQFSYGSSGTSRRAAQGRIYDAEDLGRMIRERRKKIGVTQEQLAEACQCSPRFVGELERGVAGGNIRQVLAICQAIGLDLYGKERG